jgi:hypothetical protein
MMTRSLLLGVTLLGVGWGCASQAHSRPGTANPAANMPAVAGSGDGAPMPHGDHRPRYGGLVLMDGNLHFEVVAHSDGHYRVYFSDEIRRELPASTVSEVVLTVGRPNAKPETLILSVDDEGESWMGTGRPFGDAGVMMRVAFVFDEKPYFIDIPWSQAVPAGSTMTSSNLFQRAPASSCACPRSM